MYPYRRRPHGNIQEDLDPGLIEAIHYLVEPLEIINTVLRLIAVPAKVSQPYYLKAGLLHQRNIFLPALRRPVMGMVIRSHI